MTTTRAERAAARTPPGDPLVRRMTWAGPEAPEVDALLRREWLVTNGLGGYASGTVAGVATRRYHGLLVAALPAPHGRTMTVNRLSERVRLPDGQVARLDSEHRHGALLDVPLAHRLEEFRLDAGLPVWRFRFDRFVVEKSVCMLYRQNTSHVTYRVLEGDGTLRFKLQPCVHFRAYDAPVDVPIDETCALLARGGRIEVTTEDDLPPLCMYLFGDRRAFTIEPRVLTGFQYVIEQRRGYEHVGDLWTPGYFRVDLATGAEATMVFSTEDWETVLALGPAEAAAAERHRRARLIQEAPPAARTGWGSELVLAADQFIIAPAGRVEEEARVRAAGDEARTVIAGYHWFTDWGRDTMIALEGLTLTTGRFAEAGYILRTFSNYVRDGLIPNMFPDREKEGLYHTADATLWYFHALHRYVETTGDRATLHHLLPKLVDIVRHHQRGTRFGIGVDPVDGLLRQGMEHYQLTWMDAKVADWVVTPRRGKAVEINALWYNALRLLARWLGQPEYEAGADRRLPAPAADLARELATQADRVAEAFGRRFWYEEGGYLYDVVDGEAGDDPACRPNQLFAMALDHPVLDPARWERVVGVVEERLLTPVGLRSLAPGHPDYKQRYDGDLRARDAAYHQGTVWAWLIGPFIDAWLRVHPAEGAAARRFLEGFAAHLGEACLGTISEIADAEAPYAPRGCVAQAWSVAEVLRCWVRTSS